MEVVFPNIVYQVKRNPLIVYPTAIKQIYLNNWKDLDCIRNQHTMMCCQPYGVLLICEDCNTIQTFNHMH